MLHKKSTADWRQLVMKGISMLKDEDIKKYINEYLCEESIREKEDEILHIMKMRQETYPSEKNDKEWLNFSVQCMTRRIRSDAS